MQVKQAVVAEFGRGLGPVGRAWVAVLADRLARGEWGQVMRLADVAESVGSLPSTVCRAFRAVCVADGLEDGGKVCGVNCDCGQAVNAAGEW